MFAFDFLACLGKTNLLSLLLQEESHQKEVDGNADAECGQHGYLLGQSHAHEEIQTDCLQGVVDDVRECEAGSSFGISLDTEGVACAGNEVEHETGDIGNGVGRGGQYMVVAA